MKSPNDENPSIIEAGLTAPMVPSARWKLVLRGLGTVFAIGSMVWYCYALSSRLEVFKDLTLNSYSVGTIAIGIGLYPVIYGIAAGIWIYALKCLGIALPVRSAVSISFVSQFGKYIPGNVAHHVTRVVLAKQHGASPFHVVLSMLIEAGCLVACGMAVALTALITQQQLQTELAERIPSARWQWATLAFAFISLIGAIWFYRRMKVSSKAVLEIRWLTYCIALTLVVFVVHGLIAQAILFGVFNVDNSSLIAVTGVFAFAWVIGFVTPGAPAGIGIRETVLTLGLSSVCEPGIALGLAAILRVVSALGDGLTFAVGLCLQRLRAAPLPNSSNGD